MAFDTSSYKTILAIDSQVVLETRPLEQLPWIDLVDAPILILVCRQVASEIDAKKSDGRLGTRSREFNRLLDRFIQTGVPAPLISGSGVVDIALAAHSKIDWDEYDSLEKEEPDDRIVAQVANAQISDKSRVIVLSHDLRVRDAARICGLSHLKLPDDWLRDKELTPQERQIEQLRSQVSLLKADQPEVAISIRPVSDIPFRHVEVGEPTAEQIDILKGILEERFPFVSQGGGGVLGMRLGSSDYGYEDRYDKWYDRLVSDDLPTSHLGLGRLANQICLEIELENEGKIPAENISIEVRCGNGVLYSRPYMALPFGPPSPRPRPFGYLTGIDRLSDIGPVRRDPFDFYVDQKGPGGELAWSCASFRQEKIFKEQIFVELIASSFPRISVEVVVTASNLKGDFRKRENFIVETSCVNFSDAVEFEKAVIALEEQCDPFEGLSDDDIFFVRNNRSIFRS